MTDTGIMITNDTPETCEHDLTSCHVCTRAANPQWFTRADVELYDAANITRHRPGKTPRDLVVTFEISNRSAFDRCSNLRMTRAEFRAIQNGTAVPVALGWQ